MGWVQKKFDDLIESACELGINSPEKYYSDGKAWGKSKAKTTRGMISEGQKNQKEEADPCRVTAKLNNIVEMKESVYEFTAAPFIERPILQDFPKAVEKSRITELPMFLRFFGFR